MLEEKANNVGRDADRHKVLDQWTLNLSSNDIDAKFPELRDFDLTVRDIDSAGQRFERFQTLHAVIGIAAAMVGAFTVFASFLTTHPIGKNPVGGNSKLTLLVLCVSGAVFLMFAAWEIAQSVAEERYWRNRTEDRELLSFYDRWSELSSQYDLQVEARNEERRRVQLAIRAQEIEVANQAERARHAMENIDRELNDVKEAREARLTGTSSKPFSHGTTLSKLLGGHDDDVKVAFFNLTGSAFSLLLDDYEATYGVQARQYAERTFPLWKSGETKMSAEISQRLLALVPRFMAKEELFELIRSLRRLYRPEMVHRHLVCRSSGLLTTVLPVAEEMAFRGTATPWPQELIDRVGWLLEGDAIAAQKLLAAVDAAEAEIRIQHLEEEFSRIDRMMRRMPGNHLLTHRIELPHGTITVSVSKPRPNFLQLAKRLVS